MEPLVVLTLLAPIGLLITPGGALQHTVLDPLLVDAPAPFHDHVPAEAEALVDPSAVHRGDSGLAVVGATPERDGAQVRLRVSGGVEDREGTPHVTGSGGRLFAGIYSTILRTSLVTSTTATDFFTCYSSINVGQACSGRRRRRRASMPDSLSDRDADMPLDSVDPDSVTSSRGQGGGAAAGPREKVLLTIFTTSTTTITLSTLTIDSATTVSINYSCTSSGLSTFPACG